MSDHVSVAARGPTPQTLATIGVYGFDAKSFLHALQDGDVHVLIDVRQRRGVRGSEYAWANAKRLQDALDGAGVAYIHVKELAPTTELRQVQYAEDARAGVGKRSRTELAPAYVDRYTREILDRAGIDPVLDALPPVGTAALFCVERDPEACHRSLIAARVADERGISVTHLRP